MNFTGRRVRLRRDRCGAAPRLPLFARCRPAPSLKPAGSVGPAPPYRQYPQATLLPACECSPRRPPPERAPGGEPSSSPPRILHSLASVSCRAYSTACLAALEGALSAASRTTDPMSSGVIGSAASASTTNLRTPVFILVLLGQPDPRDGSRIPKALEAARPRAGNVSYA